MDVKLDHEEVMRELRDGAKAKYLAQKYGVRLETIYAVRKKYARLAAEGKYKEPTPDVKEENDLRSPAGRLRYLEELLPEIPSTAKGKIVELIGEVAGQMGAGVGPADPLTDDEKVSRAKMIMEAAGRSNVDRAYEELWGRN